jgi:hypothetical protein
MPDDFVIARNPDEDSSLPYVVRIPLGEDGVVLKARDTWPRTAKVYCHRVDHWPTEAEIVQRVPVRSCVRRGAAIDLVLDRGKESRSQFVITAVKGGRQAIFWQTSRTAKQARPRVPGPTARAQGLADLDIVVDSGERYAWTFSDHQVTTRRERLPVGDYGVLVDGALVGVVERKGLGDLVSSLTSGKLKYQLTELASLPRAAVVVEERYSRALRHEVVRAAVVADGLAELQVAFPNVPVMFCETRKLAQQWTYRFLAAVAAAHELDRLGAETVSSLARAEPLEPRDPTPAELRAWAKEHGYAVSSHGRVPNEVRRAHAAATLRL